MAKSPFGSLADLIAQLGVQPEQPKPQEPGVETPKPQDPDKPKPEVPQSDLGKVFDKKATFTLTNKTDKFPAKEGENKGDDVIKGEVDVVSTKSTLNASDLIDGGEGDDTLVINLESAFSGFDKKGGVKNIEHIAIQSSKSRDFKAAGVDGVESYTLKGDVSLKDLKALKALNLIDRTGDVKLGFDKDTKEALKNGEDDSLAISIDGLGKAPKSKGKDPSYVGVAIEDIEALAINAVGKDSYISVDKAETLSVAGGANLDIVVGKDARSFDASKATGKITANMNLAKDIETISLGSGDDTIKLDAAKNPFASVSGGEGKDTLIVKGTGNVYLGAADGVESLMLTGTGNVSIGGENFKGLENIVLKGAGAGTISVDGISSEDMTLNLQGKATVATKIGLDNTGKTTIVVDTPDPKTKAGKFDDNQTDINLSEATVVEMTVAEKLNYKGTLTASKAEQATFTINGAMSASTIEANEATYVGFNAVDNKSSVTLKADAATNVVVTAAKEFDIATHSLKALEELEVTTGEFFKIGDIAKVDSIDLKGGEKGGAVKLGKLGAAVFEGDIKVEATGLRNTKIKSTEHKALIVGDATNVADTKGGDITFSLKEIAGDVKFDGAIKTDNGGATTGNVTLEVETTDRHGLIESEAITATEELKINLTSAKRQGTSETHVVKLGDLQGKESVEATIQATGGKVHLGAIKSDKKVALDVTALDFEAGGIQQTSGATPVADVSLKVAGVASDNKVAFGAIKADKLTLDLSDSKALASFTGNAISVTNELDLSVGRVGFGAAANNATAITITAGKADFTAKLEGKSGKENIKFAVTNSDGAGEARKFTLSGDTAAGADTIEIDTSAETNRAFTIDLSDFKAAPNGMVTIATKDDKADTIKLGAARETVKLESATNAKGTDVDTISGFKAGNSGDKIVIADLVAAGTDASHLVKFNKETKQATFTNEKIHVVEVDANINDVAYATTELAKLFGTGAAVFSATVASNAKGVLLVVGKDQTHVYSVDASSGTDTTVESGELKLMGILEGALDYNKFVAGTDSNFSITA